jgi:uncharacterized DUF497 family protein
VATVVSGDLEWNDAKAVADENKHGVTFDEAAVALASDRGVAHPHCKRKKGRSR